MIDLSCCRIVSCTECFLFTRKKPQLIVIPFYLIVNCESMIKIDEIFYYVPIPTIM